MMHLERKSPARQRGAGNFEDGNASISLTKISRKLRLAQALLAAQSISPEAFATMDIVAGEVGP